MNVLIISGMLSQRFNILFRRTICRLFLWLAWLKAGGSLIPKATCNPVIHLHPGITIERAKFVLRSRHITDRFLNETRTSPSYAP